MNKNNKKKNIGAFTPQDRPTWKGCYERVTPTKKEKERKLENKHKNKITQY